MAMASVMKDAYHTAGCAVEILRPAFGDHSVSTRRANRSVGSSCSAF